MNNMNQCRNAINELRTVAAGDRDLYKQSLKLLGDFVKKPLQPGQITRMAAAVREMNLDPVKNLLLAPGHANKFEAVCLIQKMVNSAIAQALVQVDEEGDEAQNALYASYTLLYGILCKELGREAIDNLHFAMNGEQFRVELSVAYDITQDIWAEGSADDPEQKAEARKFADGSEHPEFANADFKAAFVEAFNKRVAALPADSAFKASIALWQAQAFNDVRGGNPLPEIGASLKHGTIEQLYRQFKTEREEADPEKLREKRVARNRDVAIRVLRSVKGDATVDGYSPAWWTTSSSRTRGTTTRRSSCPCCRRCPIPRRATR